MLAVTTLNYNLVKIVDKQTGVGVVRTLSDTDIEALALDPLIVILHCWKAPV